MDWRISDKSNFCTDGSGLNAYFDPSPTKSGALRCIGPYGTDGLEPHFVKNRMLALTKQVERCYHFSDGYVVWGNYADIVEYSELSLTLLGGEYGFLPLVWIRSELVVQDAERQQVEWHRCKAHLKHRSGLVLFGDQSEELDPSLFHPRYLQQSISRLRSTATNLFSYSVTHHNVLPLVNWTRVKASQTKKFGSSGGMA